MRMTRKGLITTAFLAFVLVAGIAPVSQAADEVVQSQLYFGLRSLDGSGVSEQEWARFLAEVITPRFPDGLTVLGAYGQGRSGPPTTPITAETTKILVIVHPATEEAKKKLTEIKQAYMKTFNQDSVFHVEVPARLVD